jgi:hypothetical protein
MAAKFRGRRSRRILCVRTSETNNFFLLSDVASPRRRNEFKEQNVRWVARVMAAIQNQCDNNEDAANTPMADNYDLWQTGP